MAGKILPGHEKGQKSLANEYFPLVEPINNKCQILILVSERVYEKLVPTAIQC